MSFLEGQEFTIPQPAGVKVVAFAVNQTFPDKWDKLPMFVLEKIECTENYENGRTEKKFFIPTEQDSTNVIILSLAKNRCVIGHGKVQNNAFIADSETAHLQYTTMADVDEEEKEFKFRYNSKRQIVIIDPENGDQIMPKIIKNEVTKGFQGVYKLIPYKNYVALELAVKFANPGLSAQKKNDELSNESVPLSMEEIANMKI